MALLLPVSAHIAPLLPVGGFMALLLRVSALYDAAALVLFLREG